MSTGSVTKIATWSIVLAGMVSITAPSSPAQGPDDPPRSTIDTEALLAIAQSDGLPATIRILNPMTGAVQATFVPRDFPNNGMLLPATDIQPGPNRTVLVAQPIGDKIAQYDDHGNFLGNYLEGPIVNNIRGIARSADGGFLFTSDWTGDNVHRFRFLNRTPAGSSPDGEFIVGMQPPPALDQPYAMAVLGDGALLVGDIGARRLKLFDPGSGAFIALFSEANVTGDITDIDVMPNGDVVVAHGPGVSIFSPTGELIDSFAFRAPNGVHRLADGTFLVTSEISVGQGRGLFRVSIAGAILETLDNTRGYGALENVRLVPIGGDCNNDRSITTADLEEFAGCSGGPESPLEKGCACSDTDFDNDADLLDFAEMQRRVQ